MAIRLFNIITLRQPTNSNHHLPSSFPLTTTLQPTHIYQFLKPPALLPTPPNPPFPTNSPAAPPNTPNLPLNKLSLLPNPPVLPKAKVSLPSASLPKASLPSASLPSTSLPKVSPLARVYSSPTCTPRYSSKAISLRSRLESLLLLRRERDDVRLVERRPKAVRVVVVMVEVGML